MGGIVSAPQPVVHVAPMPVAKVDVARKTDDTDTSARRGRSVTIQTSPRGLIQIKPEMPQKKSLLGE